jgi:cystathionine beta-synthase
MAVVVYFTFWSRYVGKMFNDDWMRERGFLEKEEVKKGIEDVIKIILTKPLIVAHYRSSCPPSKRMRKYNFTNTGNGYVRL